MKIKKPIILSFIFIFTFLILAVGIKADEVITAPNGIQISPLTYSFELKPGQSQRAKVVVTNLNAVEMNYFMESGDFTVISDDGAPVFDTQAKREGLTTLADWISFEGENQGTLKAGDKKDIYFNINVPETAESGGHYAAVFARQIKTAISGQTELGVSGRVGTLVYLTVNGDANMTKTTTIQKFDYQKFVQRGPLNFKAVLFNSGNVHYDCDVTLKIQPLIGKSIDLDMGTHTMIAKNARSFAARWDKNLPFGYYKLTLVAKEGNRQVATVSGAFWAVPLNIVIPVVIFLIVLIILAIYFSKHLKFVKTPA